MLMGLPVLAKGYDVATIRIYAPNGSMSIWGDMTCCWIRCRRQVRKHIQDIFGMNGDGEKSSNKRTEKCKWLCHKMANPGINIKTEKWYNCKLPFDTLTSDTDSCKFLGRQKPEPNLQQFASVSGAGV
jgi:hypothetical protein